MKTMKYLLLLIFMASSAWAATYKYPVPKDFTNTPIYGGLGLPVYGAAVTLTDSTFTDLLTVPSTGNDTKRQFAHICVFNPSGTRTLNICFGTGCTTTQISVPAFTGGGGICLDDTYFGVYNEITVIRGAIDAAGSVTPQLTIW